MKARSLFQPRSQPAVLSTVPKRSPGDPREWLKRSYSDLKLADVRRKGVYREDLCFHAQQAAEKALKAVLIHRGVKYPFSHDLGVLVRFLKDAGVVVPIEIQEVARLTRFAVAARYPSIHGPTSAEEYRKVLLVSRRAVKWAEGLIGEKRR